MPGPFYPGEKIERFQKLQGFKQARQNSGVGHEIAHPAGGRKGLHVRIATTPLYGDTMGVKGTGADTYLDMIEHNVHTLVDQLSKE